MLSTSTFVFGAFCTMTFVASRPFMSGMLISINTIAGAQSCTHLIASRPFCASATIFMFGCVDNRARMPSRTIGWSSAKMILIGSDFIGLPSEDRQLFDFFGAHRNFRRQPRYSYLNAGTFVRNRFKLNKSANERHALHDAEQSHAGLLARVRGSGGRRLETNAVV